MRTMNINALMLVRLTAKAREILAENHAKTFAGYEKPPAYEEPEATPEGYTAFPLWLLMAEFGAHCRSGRGGELFVGNLVRVADGRGGAAEVERHGAA